MSCGRREAPLKIMQDRRTSTNSERNAMFEIIGLSIVGGVWLYGAVVFIRACINEADYPHGS